MYVSTLLLLRQCHAISLRLALVADKEIMYHTQLCVHNCKDWLNIATKFLLTLEDVVDDEAGSQSQECALPPSSAPPPLRDLFGKRCCATGSARENAYQQFLQFYIAVIYD